MKNDHGLNLLKCQHCNEIFSEIENLKIHTSEIHYKQTSTENGPIISCRFCMAGFENCSALTKHTCKSQILRKSDHSKMLKCQFCVYRFVKEENLKMHTARIHGKDVNEKFKSQSEMSCRFCRNLFQNESSFAYHLSIG